MNSFSLMIFHCSAEWSFINKKKKKRGFFFIFHIYCSGEKKMIYDIISTYIKPFVENSEYFFKPFP